MIWRIMPHASACIASDCLVLLDVRQDRYFLVPASIAEGMRAWLQCDGSGPAPERVGRLLVQSGIVRPGDPPLANSARETVRVPDALALPAPEPGALAVTAAAHVAAIVMATWLDLRVRPLHAVLDRRRNRTIGRAPEDGAALIARSRSFDTLRRFTPLKRSCLLDSLALRAWLGPAAADCKLVFGITARPFAAHCWLQSSNQILNDSFDRVSRYVPILAL